MSEKGKVIFKNESETFLPPSSAGDIISIVPHTNVAEYVEQLRISNLLADKEEFFNLMREWVKAEIEYAFAIREKDEDGYMQNARYEQDETKRLFQELSEKFSDIK